MNTRLIVWLAAFGLLACSAPEENPELRCNAERRCEEPLVCYREYCIDPDGESDPDVVLADAGAISADASSVRDAAVFADAAVAVVPTTSTPTYTDVPGTSGTVTPVVTTVTTPVTTPVQTPAPVSCIAECTQGTNKNACKDCFKEEYGDEPEKLCGDKKVDPSMSTICASVCGVNKWSVSCQQTPHAAGPAAGKAG